MDLITTEPTNDSLNSLTIVRFLGTLLQSIGCTSYLMMLEIPF